MAKMGTGRVPSLVALTSDFVWIDDQPLKVEIEALRGRGLLSRLIVIDTNKDADALLRVAQAISPGSLAEFAAMRRASSLVSSLAVERRPGSSSK